jgi:hypothetical protein
LPANSNAYASAGNSSDGGSRGFFSFGQPDPEPPAARAPAAAPARQAPEPALLAPVPSTETGSTPDRPADAPLVQMLAAIPVPPRRPAELAPLLEPVLVSMPIPPTRPVTLASVQGSVPVLANDLKGQMRNSPPAAVPPPSRALAPNDERAALRALFAAVVTPTIEQGSTITATRARPQPLGGSGPIADPSANLRVGFSSAETSGLRADRFSGPAVVPLPILR